MNALWGVAALFAAFAVAVVLASLVERFDRLSLEKKMLNLNWKLIGAKFVAGIETYLFGLAMTLGPQALDYTVHFDWTKIGLTPNAASTLGLILIALRGLDSIGEAVRPVPAAPGLTGAEVAGNNAANKLRSFAFLGLLAAAAPVLPSSCAQNAAKSINSAAADIVVVNGAFLNIDDALGAAASQQWQKLGVLPCGAITLGQAMEQDPTLKKSITSYLQKQKLANAGLIAISALCALRAS